MSQAEKVAAAMWGEDSASRALGMKLEAVGEGHARLSMEVAPHMANGQKLCHGGFIFTLADSTFAYACNAHNQRALAASCAIDFLAPAYVGDRLVAEAAEVARGGRRGIYDVRISNQKGEIVAVFRGQSATVKGTWI